MHGEHDIPDPDKIKEILDVVSEKIPALLKELSGVLYSPEQAKQFGLAGATFYKELKAAGLTDDQAFELTNQYMSTLNIGNAIKSFDHHGDGWYSHNRDYGRNPHNRQSREIVNEQKRFKKSDQN